MNLNAFVILETHIAHDPLSNIFSTQRLTENGVPKYSQSKGIREQKTKSFQSVAYSGFLKFTAW